MSVTQQLALFATPRVPPHPATFSQALVPHLAEAVRGRRLLLDPFAGVGGIYRIARIAAVDAVGVEIEPGWAAQHPRTVVGNALNLPFADATFDAVCTSPTYGNRMSDHHDARDGSVRHTYRHYYGTGLHPDNSGAMPWGPDYWTLHKNAWAEAVRVLEPGSRFVLNVKDFYADGKVVDVTGWHLETLTALGFTLVDDIVVATPGQRNGANGHLRVDHEHILVLEEGAQ